MPPRPTARISRLRRCAASIAGSGMRDLLSGPMPVEFPPDMSHLDHDGRQAESSDRAPKGRGLASSPFGWMCFKSRRRLSDAKFESL